MNRTWVRWVLFVVVASSTAVSCAMTTAFTPTPAIPASGGEAAEATGPVEAVYASRDYVLAGRGSVLEVHAADGSYQLGSLALEHGVEDIAVAGTRAYVAAGQGWLYVVDLTDLARPALLDHIPLPDFDPETDPLTHATASAARGEHAFVALYEGGLWAVDLAQSPPTSTHGGSYVWDVELAGDYLLGLDTPEVNSGYSVWNIATPDSPQPAGAVDLGERVADLQVAGQYLYVAAQFTGLQIRAWNPSQPLSPTLVAQLALDAPVVEVAVSDDGRAAFLITGSGLVYVDVSDPAHPAVKDTASGSFGFYDELAVAGNSIFVARGEHGLHRYTFDANGLSYVGEVTPTTTAPPPPTPNSPAPPAARFRLFLPLALH